MQVEGSALRFSAPVPSKDNGDHVRRVRYFGGAMP
jgi:hypothetical protein